MFTGGSVLVTGAARGIGLAIARSFLQDGAGVMLNDVDSPGLEKAMAGLGVAAGRAVACRADVTREDEVQRMVGSFLERFGHIDILVNNAGIYPNSLLVEMSEEEWDRVIAVNLKGAFLICRAVAKKMLEQGRGGKIINISSGSYRVARVGCAHYCASKAGLVMFSKALALELAPHGISVNCVAPGLIQPDAGNSQITREYCEEFVKSIPAGRIGQPEDIAGAVKLLASPWADYVTGEVLVVDGGLSAGRFTLRRSSK